MARPRKQENERRAELVAFRVTSSDRLRIEYAAIAAGAPRASEFARMRTLSGETTLLPSGALPFPVFDELRRIGVNLLQLERAATEAGKVPPELGRAASLFDEILAREMARPHLKRSRTKRDPDTRLVAQIRFRVTPAQHHDIAGKAQAAGLTVSEYARQQTLNGQVVVVAHDRVFNPDMLDELRAAGIVINSATRRTNQSGRLPDDLHELCAGVERIIAKCGIAEAAPPRANRSAPAPSPGGP